MKRIAAIDFGLARIGIAISDERQIIASPLKTVRAAKEAGKTAQLVAEALSVYPQLETIVIGLPLLLSGKESPMSTQARAFGKALEPLVHCPIIFWDERLTSAGVEKMLKGCDLSRKKRAELSDPLSAISILQNYLDALRFKKL